MRWNSALWKGPLAFFLGIVSTSAAPDSASAAADSAAEQAKARAYLKEHLQQLNRAYPFPGWEKKLRDLRSAVEKFKARKPLSGPFNPSLKRDFETLGSGLDSLRKIRPRVEALIREMYVQTVLLQVEERFRRDGTPITAAGREAFYRALKPYEAGSLRPKTDFLAHLVGLDKSFSDAHSAWLFEWAKKVLPKRIDAHLETARFAAHEAARQDLALKADYWARQIDQDAEQAARQLHAAADSARLRASKALADLEQLETALLPEMLFSELLEQAQRENFSLTVEAEARIEAALASRHEALLRPVQEKIAAWKALDPQFRAALAKADAAADRQRQLARAREEREKQERKRQEAQAMAKAEQDRLERERLEAEARERAERERQEQVRLEALAAEQRRAEEAQREQFRNTVNSWKNLQLAGNGLISMDSATRNALDTRAEKLKTSEVGSGRKRLKVESSKFSDTLAFVEKFVVGESKLDLSKVSLEEKASQSAYVFASPSGRTTPKDLDQFVQNVALGSFDAYYQFLSYVAPHRWKAGKPLAWQADRRAEPVAQDRVFSYVDLVVDAHRKRNRPATTAADRARANMPANMIVIFDPRGGVRRFQSFGDIRQVSIRREDLHGGKLHYKFLNYGVDRRNIYLNGIDAEIKVSAPES